MKILVIGTIDNQGGAAQVAWELRRRLKLDGHGVETFARYTFSKDSDVHKIPRRRFQDWLVKLFANDLTFANTSYIFNTKEYKEADIIHCHNLHSNFFNLKDLVRMTQEKPVVWTLHDMWAFTGFAYNSITLERPNKKRFLLYLWDNTPFLFKTKARIYKKIKCTIVTVSDWLKSKAEESIIGNQKILRIYNGIDIDTFKPQDKIYLRNKLKLPLDKKIVACGIKGWDDCQKIINSYANRNDVFFVTIGHNNIKTTNPNFIVLPRTENRQVLATYLGAIDIFFHPTPEDSFGLISAEAMSCGIPVVTYNRDALPEIVDHLKTGYVANYKDIVDATKGIEHILNLSSTEYREMSLLNRKKIENYFSTERMYKEYLNLYKSLLK